MCQGSNTDPPNSSKAAEEADPPSLTMGDTAAAAATVSSPRPTMAKRDSSSSITRLISSLDETSSTAASTLMHEEEGELSISDLLLSPTRLLPVPKRNSTTSLSTTTSAATTAAPSSRRSSMKMYRRASNLSNSSRGLASFAHLSDFLAEEGLMQKQKRRNSLQRRGSHDSLIPSRRDSLQRKASLGSLGSCLSDYMDDMMNAHELNEQATEAIKDFALQLKYYGKSSLDEEAFDMLLDDIGYTRPREGLFDSFLLEVSNASPSHYIHHDDPVQTRSVTVQDLKHLYNSEPYRLPQSAGFNNGEALMSYIEKMFREVDITGDEALDCEELREFMKMVFEDDGKVLTEDELNEAMKTLDIDQDGKIDFDEFKSFMLKANLNDTCEISSEFNEGLLSPSHTSEEEFVTELENYTKTHRAVTHHLLTNLACASFGKKETADMLLRFLSAYTHFNSGFIGNVLTLMGLLDDENHKEILSENLEEEMGEYDEETLRACEEMGIPRESVDGIPHRDLFKDLVGFVETVLQRSYERFIPKYICEKLNQAIAQASEKGKLGLLAVLYFGSELIVPQIYSSILQGLRNSIDISNEDARFLILHIDMDQDHAVALREIILSNCRTKADRVTLVQCTKTLLDARISFYDALIKYSSLDPVAHSRNAIQDEEEAQKWINSMPSDCAIDFTGRSTVLEMCKDHVNRSTILDLGCGEGSVSRHFIKVGATKTVGIDISPVMIAAANAHPEKQNGEYYVEGDVSSLKETLLMTTNKTNLMPGAQFDVGLFDLSVAVFVFNYLTITSMDKTFKDVFSLLKPGGQFVFSVPHPFMASQDGENFGFVQHGSSSYFALRDKLLEGHVNTLSGDRLEVRMYCKTFSDYIDAARKHGFDIVQIEEARVSDSNLHENPAFFDSVNGVPLHLVVKLRKPGSQVKDTTNLMAASSANSLNMLPKKLNWSRAIMRHPKNAFYLQIPDQVRQELHHAALECFNRGISVDDLDEACDFPSTSFSSLRSFAVSVRNILLHETGLVLLKGLELDAFGLDEEKMVVCSKIAYYLMCNHIGAVDGSVRGRLFDVKDNNINAMGSADNILFSVSNCEANWHTDGASRDRVYDAVGLLCIHPASIGGKSKVSNACDAYDKISRTMPKFLMRELLRPVSRDILENGKGNKSRLSIGSQLSRAASIMSLRISYNSYPIFDVQQDRMRFRYMRYWIERAHKKMHWYVPTLLKIAMDVLDDTLDEGCCFHESLEQGDILICNNACIAHGRDSFQDTEEPHRHLVRAWMQVQKVDLLKPSNQSAL